MGYENVKLKEQICPCDLSIGQKFYYESDYDIREVEIVAIDCSKEDDVRLLFRHINTNETSTYDVSAEKRNVFGKDLFIVFGTLKMDQSGTWKKDGKMFYRNKKELANKIIVDIESDISLMKYKLEELKKIK